MEKRQGLTECPERALDAGLTVRLGRGVLGLEQRADRLGHVLGEPKNVFWNVRFLLERFECFAEQLARLSRIARR
ncbi:MAG: hypothetical protein ACN4G0_05660 [Polyangiales bacterium]